MGLSVKIKGYENAYDCGYITYGLFLRELVNTYYANDSRMQYIFNKQYAVNDNITDEDIEYWDAHCNNDLDILLYHSDCDGKFTPKECKTIYNCIKDLSMDMIGHNYGDMKPYNMLEKWKDMFHYCYTHRVNMYYC